MKSSVNLGFNPDDRRFFLVIFVIILLIAVSYKTKASAQDSFVSNSFTNNGLAIQDSLAVSNFQNNLNLSFQSKKSRAPEAVKIIAIYAGSIMLNAVGDGLNNNGEKGWGHACNAGSYGLLLASPFIIDYDQKKWGWYLASYVCLRFALFDPTYNKTRGLPFDYIGTSSGSDKLLQKFKPASTWPFRGGSFLVGVFIPINEIGRKHKPIH